MKRQVPFELFPASFLSRHEPNFRNKESGRGGQIRTDDFLLPKQALYQAELRPAAGPGTVCDP